MAAGVCACGGVVPPSAVSKGEKRCRACWYKDQEKEAEERFEPVREALIDAGWPAADLEVWQTGGMVFCIAMITRRDAKGMSVAHALMGEAGLNDGDPNPWVEDEEHGIEDSLLAPEGVNYPSFEDVAELSAEELERSHREIKCGDEFPEERVCDDCARLMVQHANGVEPGLSIGNAKGWE